MRYDLSGSGGDDELLPVQLGEFEGNSSQGIQQGDLLGDEQISSSSLIDLVVLDQDSDVQIPCHDSRLNKKFGTYSSLSPVKI